ncbi:unnamed protein product, partial [Prorocentrum cordatum]
GSRKARGVDGLGSGDLEGLPTVGRDELRPLLARCEERRCRPHQLMGVAGGALPKGAGGKRAVGLLPLALEIWSRARSVVASAWAEELGAFWGAAVRGSSAAQAALVCSLLDETGVELEVAAAALLLGAGVFYDAVSLVKQVQLFLTPRCLEDSRPGKFAQAGAARSIVADSARRVSSGKLYPSQLMQ